MKVNLAAKIACEWLIMSLAIPTSVSTVGYMLNRENLSQYLLPAVCGISVNKHTCATFK